MKKGRPGEKKKRLLAELKQICDDYFRNGLESSVLRTATLLNPKYAYRNAVYDDNIWRDIESILMELYTGATIFFLIA